MLGCRIHRLAGGGNEPCDGCCVDDVSLALPHHDRVDRLDPVRNAAYVDVDHVVPIALLVVCNVASDANPSVVEEVVDGSPTSDGGFDHAGHRSHVTHIELQSDRGSTTSTNRCG